MSTFWSYEKAPTSALGSSSFERANLTPRAEPWLAGLTTSGNPSALSMSDSSAAAPSSLIDSSRTEWKSGVGTPASRIRYLASTLSVQRVHAAGPEPDKVLAKYLMRDRKSTRLNSSHDQISYAVFCLK